MILVVDIETTGWLNAGGKIVEIGIVELDINTGHSKVIYDELVLDPLLDPDKLKTSWICTSSYIDASEVLLKGRPMDKVFDEVQNLFNNSSKGITAFNSDFDFKFLKSYGFTLPKELGCLMKLSVDICKLPKTGKAAKYPGYKWPTAEEAYKHFFPEADYVEKHRGADDALHEASVAFELLKLGVLNV